MVRQTLERAVNYFEDMPFRRGGRRGKANNRNNKNIVHRAPRPKGNLLRVISYMHRAVRGAVDVLGKNMKRFDWPLVRQYAFGLFVWAVIMLLAVGLWQEFLKEMGK